MADLTNAADVLSTVGVPAATALGICWGAIKWALPRLLNDQIAVATKPALDALERRLGEQQKAVLQELTKNTGQIARSLEKMSERLSEQGADLAELRGEVRAARNFRS